MARAVGRFAAALPLAVVALSVLACEPQPIERSAAGEDTTWAIPVREGTEPASESCDRVVDRVIQAAAEQPGLVVTISGYAASSGSTSLALAQVAGVANRLREALLRKSGKMRLPIEARLIADVEGGQVPGDFGRVILRLHLRRK